MNLFEFCFYQSGISAHIPEKTLKCTLPENSSFFCPLLFKMTQPKYKKIQEIFRLKSF